MKAIRIHQFGGPEMLRYEDVDQPQPQAGEVVLRTRAAGINYADLMLRQNTYFFTPPLPYTLGFDVVGTVEAVGPGVTNVRMGQRVLGSNRGGGYAEFVVLPAGGLVVLPAGVPDAEATALNVQGLTAMGLLKDVRAGQSILVHAAAGGVGTLLVQLAKLRGARVIGTASSPQKLALIKQLGADVALDYSHDDWPDQVRQATNGAGVNWLIDGVGGKIGAASLSCLATHGTLLVYGKASGQDYTLTPWDLVGNMQTVTGFYLGQVQGDFRHQAMQQLLDYVAQDQLRIDVTAFPLAQAADAHRAIEGRQTSGKVVLTCAAEVAS